MFVWKRPKINETDAANGPLKIYLASASLNKT